MAQVMKCALLDFFTLKSELKLRQLITIGLFTFLGFHNVGVYGIGLGFMPLVTLFVAHPFSMGGDGLDALYAALSIPRKTVVMGRYVFLVGLVILSTALYMAVAFILSTALGAEANMLLVLAILGMAAVVAIFTSAFSIPFLFRVGFKQGKTMATMIPTFLMLGVFMLANFQLDTDVYGIETLPTSPDVFPGGMIIIAIVGLCLVVCLSYVMSAKFYLKRDF